MTRGKLLMAAAASSALFALASPASAATLVSAEVTGCCAGTVWDTQPNGFYTLFVAKNSGFGVSNALNPNDEALNLATVAGLNDFLTAGDGWVPGQLANSDLTYNLTLTFAGGGTLKGSYTPFANSFSAVGGPLVVGGETLTLTQFSFTRTQGNPVQPFKNIPGGDPFDYAGSFAFTSSGAVPEPGTWAMMLLGFGAVGFGLRKRKATQGQTRLRVAYV